MRQNLKFLPLAYSNAISVWVSPNGSRQRVVDAISMFSVYSFAPSFVTGTLSINGTPVHISFIFDGVLDLKIIDAGPTQDNKPSKTKPILTVEITNQFI